MALGKTGGKVAPQRSRTMEAMDHHNLHRRPSAKRPAWMVNPLRHRLANLGGIRAGVLKLPSGYLT
jgi:hypothetical protein